MNTTLNLSVNRTNTGRSAVIATLASGRQVLIGESDALGRKRAIMEVLTVNNRHIRKLESEEAFAAADRAAEQGDTAAADSLWQRGAELANA